ncbi:MAG: 3-hydroxyacyl-CoA dehydrogenase NAD-binding domain-containing protein, partial [Pseudomonadota bacterium]
MFEGLRLTHWRHHRTDRNIVHLIMDTADANANTFSRLAMRELGSLIERIEIEPPAGVVFRSGKDSGFIAGADVKEFEQVAREGQEYETIRAGQQVFDRVAALSCPTVAAINGFCMGGGTELALACDYRVATDASRIGLPEVMLGIHPGWGGTVRLPELIGAPDAFDLMLTGRGLRAGAARGKGLIDQIAAEEGLVAAAEKLVLSRRRPRRAPWYLRLLSLWPARQALARVVRQKTRSKANPRHYPAPFAMIELWRRHGGNPRRMMLAEARSMAKLAGTDTARNLTRVFFLREAMRDVTGKNVEPIEHVHVIGAGVMGGDIAAWCALRGLNVTLQDREAKYVEPALARARKLFTKKLKTPERIAEAEGRLSMDIEGSGVAEADVVLEAIFENLEAKQALFREAEPRMKAGAIMATNTSSIPLQDLAEALKDPSRLIGLHYFNPVAQMPLLEVVTHDALDDAVVDRCRAHARGLDKLPVEVTSTPGFLVNRILMPYMLEAVTLLNEGVPGRIIDKAAKDFGMPMGPIELADQVGLDVAASVAQVLSEHLGVKIPEGLGDRAASDKRGKKDGEGFYRYEDGKPVKP